MWPKQNANALAIFFKLGLGLGLGLGRAHATYGSRRAAALRGNVTAAAAVLGPPTQPRTQRRRGRGGSGASGNGRLHAAPLTVEKAAAQPRGYILFN